MIPGAVTSLLGSFGSCLGHVSDFPLLTARSLLAVAIHQPLCRFQSCHHHLPLILTCDIDIFKHLQTVIASMIFYDFLWSSMLFTACHSEEIKTPGLSAPSDQCRASRSCLNAWYSLLLRSLPRREMTRGTSHIPPSNLNLLIPNRKL